jgi:predicted DNA-binding protein (MmcQ/YjbR family)
VVNWLNKKFNDTPLKGTGSFVLATFLALIGASLKVAFSSQWDTFSWEVLGVYFAQVFTVSQLWFVLIYEKLGLDVKS